MPDRCASEGRLEAPAEPLEGSERLPYEKLLTVLRTEDGYSIAPKAATYAVCVSFLTSPAQVPRMSEK